MEKKEFDVLIYETKSQNTHVKNLEQRNSLFAILHLKVKVWDFT